MLFPCSFRIVRVLDAKRFAGRELPENVHKFTRFSGSEKKNYAQPERTFFETREKFKEIVLSTSIASVNLKTIRHKLFFC